jgi:hypothetical protein
MKIIERLSNRRHVDICLLIEARLMINQLFVASFVREKIKSSLQLDDALKNNQSKRSENNYQKLAFNQGFKPLVLRPGVGKVRLRSRMRLFGPLSAALAQISVIKHPLKAIITDLNFSPFGIDISNFEIQMLDLKK